MANRLQTILDQTYKLLIERLHEKFGNERTFLFSPKPSRLADLRNITNRTTGWACVFRNKRAANRGQIIIHIRMLDESNVDQPEALGIIGVNLLYSAFYHRQPEKVIASLQENLAPARIPVDMIKLFGPAVPNVDNRLTSSQLVSQGFTNAAMFPADGGTVQPADIPHKTAMLVYRTRSRNYSRAIRLGNEWSHQKVAEIIRTRHFFGCRAFSAS